MCNTTYNHTYCTVTTMYNHFIIAPDMCAVFPGSSDSNSLLADPNVGQLTCNQPHPTLHTACISGTWQGSTPGQWEATNLDDITNQMSIVSFCSTPTDCKILIADQVGSQDPTTWTLTNLATQQQYVKPILDNGIVPLTTDGTFFIVTDICCGSCADCSATCPITTTTPTTTTPTTTTAMTTTSSTSQCPMCSPAPCASVGLCGLTNPGDWHDPSSPAANTGKCF